MKLALKKKILTFIQWGRQWDSRGAAARSAPIQGNSSFSRFSRQSLVLSWERITKHQYHSVYSTIGMYVDRVKINKSYDILRSRPHVCPTSAHLPLFFLPYHTMHYAKGRMLKTEFIKWTSYFSMPFILLGFSFSKNLTVEANY